MYEIMKSLHNFFSDVDEIQQGKWKIENGTISLPFLKSGQYYIIDGSSFNDFVCHKYGSESLTNEEFEGFIIPLKVPKEFVTLCNEIKTWRANEDRSNFTSESFGGYSYSKAKNPNGTPMGWQGAFRDRLNVWRKI